MTREEAIRCLDVYSSTNGSGLCTDKQHYEAKKMAIKALEQKPCDDVISRADAILQIQRHGVGCFDPDEFSPEVCERFVINLISELPSYRCEDAISREELDKALYEHFHEEDSPNNITDVHLGAVRNFIKNFPSVNPKPKTGHWIYDDEHSSWSNETYKCSCCKRAIIVPYEAREAVYKDYPYCHCGAKMIEPQESEG